MEVSSEDLEDGQLDEENIDCDSNLFSISIEPEKNFSRILYHREISIVPEQAKEEVPANVSISGTCWNCGGPHGIRDCKEEYNAREVNRRRALTKSKPGSSFKRYHLELHDSNIKPGVISPKLREALGLSKEQLPRHVYIMRALGYPPGWFEECKVDPDIDMLDSNGERVPDGDEEEGEIYVKKPNFDFSKIVEYPGFNVWPDPGTINETDEYRVPPMCKEQSKECFIEELKRLMEPNDLDIIGPPSDDEEPEVLSDQPLPQDVEEEVATEENGKRKQEEEEEQTEEVEEHDIEDGEILPKKKKKRKISNNEVAVEITVADNLISEPTHGQIKSIELGTPSLKIHSSYTKLPPSEAFSKQISDVVYFENLPNSTGKYEQLKVVLDKARSKLSSLREKK